MDAFLVLILTLAFLFLVGYTRRLPLFVVLLLGALFFGLLAGAGPDPTLLWMATGMGSMFTGFAIAILSGIVIVQLLADQGLLNVLVGGIRAKFRHTRAGAGLAAFVLAVPVTCPVVTCAILSPVFKHLDPERARANLLVYVAAACAIVSYIVILPTPFTQPLVAAFSPALSLGAVDLVTIPVALFLLILVVVVSGWWPRLFPGRSGSGSPAAVPQGTTVTSWPADGEAIPWSTHLRAWAPFIAILAALAAALFVLGLSHVAILQFITLAGLIVALLLAPRETRMRSFAAGITTAAPVILDVCAAGAIGTVVVKSGFAQSAFAAAGPVLPAVLLPFVVAASLAVAQGSRVTTAVVTAQVIGATGIVNAVNPLVLLLMVAAGSCMVCHVTDPFFHFVRHITGDDTRTVLKNYTLPLACIGMALFITALVLAVFVMPPAGAGAALAAGA